MDLSWSKILFPIQPGFLWRTELERICSCSQETQLRTKMKRCFNSREVTQMLMYWTGRHQQPSSLSSQKPSCWIFMFLRQFTEKLICPWDRTYRDTRNSWATTTHPVLKLSGRQGIPINIGYFMSILSMSTGNVSHTKEQNWWKRRTLSKENYWNPRPEVDSRDPQWTRSGHLSPQESNQTYVVIKQEKDL